MVFETAYSDLELSPLRREISTVDHPIFATRDFDVNIAKGLISAASVADGFSSLYFIMPSKFELLKRAGYRPIKQCKVNDHRVRSQLACFSLLTYLRCILDPARDYSA